MDFYHGPVRFYFYFFKFFTGIARANTGHGKSMLWNKTRGEIGEGGE